MESLEVKDISGTTHTKVERKEILYSGYFYDVTEFIKKHPGGRIITYYTQTGEDSTVAVQQFHSRSMKRVNIMMNTLKKRPASSSEIGLNAEQIEKGRVLTEDFTKLYLELKSEGLFEPSYTHIFLRIVDVLVMALVGYSLLWSSIHSIKIIGMLIFGLSLGRCGWIQHECGHNSMSGNPKIDRLMHVIFMGIGMGLSSTWWARQHNRHHAMPQRLNYDVDLNTMPVIAYSANVVKNSKDGKGFMIQNQAYMFMVIDTLLIGWLWKLYLHPKFVYQRKYYLQIGAMIFHWLLLYHIGFWPAIIVSYIKDTYLLVNFTLNHTFLPTTSEPLHWVEFALLHTADVEQTTWCDYWMGYLNYQIEHHLFPTMPQFRHPLIKDRVRALAEKHNIPYIVHSYAGALRKVFQNLHDVSKELKYL
ncbi:acyl-lipid (8-3)-desaturase-like isoform X2 [Bradysia coprophila]|uniref:acyl-lipid (8-3)-desaturase-like isoform X2 n=1 Tax=Bradysia coprophila TaxID=38358 RepID=UPI00187DC810|nr:acyl-lipid (8-3)-desaturase-like isoform X2 [Bradysia coprophila]